VDPAVIRLALLVVGGLVAAAINVALYRGGLWELEPGDGVAEDEELERERHDDDGEHDEGGGGAGR